ncbi:MAG TPA: hypothetical protein VKP64_02030 [Mycobacteriales bacterium]|nr:hypothetical protein [Mycobacteriales bacterium]
MRDGKTVEHQPRAMAERTTLANVPSSGVQHHLRITDVARADVDGRKNALDHAVPQRVNRCMRRDVPL